MQYESSPEKDIVRAQFDRPLIEASHRVKGQPLRYLGLPGEKALDLKTWGHLLEYIAAIEVDRDRMRALERHLDTHYSHIRYRTHLGDADRIILDNGSVREERGRREFRHVAVAHRPQRGYIWDFDVVYLDYFGKFLPYDRGSRPVQNRAQALRRLFDLDREDAWQPWLLMVTVESGLFGNRDRAQMRDFLAVERNRAAGGLAPILDYFLQTGLNRELEAARLVHGTLAYVISTAAANADVAVLPRPTVMYAGSRGLPMLHFAYHIVPTGTLTGHQQPLSLLRAPFVGIRHPVESPWFQLLHEQPQGLSEADIRSAFDFLDTVEVGGILA